MLLSGSLRALVEGLPALGLQASEKSYAAPQSSSGHTEDLFCTPQG